MQETRRSKLIAIVTGTPEKAEKWKKQYSIPDKNIYNRKNFYSIKDNPDVDIVYVVLPNALYAEYVVRAAKAGKHVICEKPMAVSVKECEQMINACKDANKLLSIGTAQYEEMGLRDVKILTAIYEAAKSGKKVMLKG